MSSIHTIEFQYPNGEKLTVTNKSFLESVKMVLNGKFDKIGTPIKVLFPTTKKVLYFDDDYFQSYLADNISQSELIELTECDGLYRNKEDRNDFKHPFVEKGALWKKQGDSMILIDRDQYISLEKGDLETFEEI